MSLAQLHRAERLLTVTCQNSELTTFATLKSTQWFAEQVEECALSGSKDDARVARCAPYIVDQLRGALFLLSTEGEHLSPFLGQGQAPAASEVEGCLQRFAKLTDLHV
jgi:hypothetical protein